MESDLYSQKNKRLTLDEGRQCRAQMPVRLTCSQGQRVTMWRGCGECEACQNDWRKRVRRKIHDGVTRTPGVEYQFVTLTFEGGRAPVGVAAKAWRSFYRANKGLRFFRVFEPHKSGGVHIHAIVEKRFPTVPDFGANETLRQWKSRLSPEAREFVEGLRQHGFGPVCSVKTVRGSGWGAAAYLGKYLTKSQWRQLRRHDGRRARVAEGSRGWNGAQLPSEWRYTLREDELPGAEECECCETAPGESRMVSRVRHRKRWLALAGLPPKSLCEAFAECWREYQRAFEERSRALDAEELVWSDVKRANRRLTDAKLAWQAVVAMCRTWTAAPIGLLKEELL